MVRASRNEPRFAIFLASVNQGLPDTWIFNGIEEDPRHRCLWALLEELFRVLSRCLDPVLEFPSLLLLSL